MSVFCLTKAISNILPFLGTDFLCSPTYRNNYTYLFNLIIFLGLANSRVVMFCFVQNWLNRFGSIFIVVFWPKQKLMQLELRLGNSSRQLVSHLKNRQLVSHHLVKCFTKNLISLNVDFIVSLNILHSLK